MLKQINFATAKELINNKATFTRAYIDETTPNKTICFDLINEYGSDSRDDCINWSERFGKITEKVKKMNLFDVFYDEEFQRDGSFAYLNGYNSVFDLLDEEDFFNWAAEGNVFFLTDGNMEEISHLAEDYYIFIKAE